MKIVAKYTLVLGALLVAALALVAVVRVAHDRDRFIRDMEVDHRVLGRLLQTGVTDLWIDRDAASATRQTTELVDRANEHPGAIRFSWDANARDGDASQRIEGHDFVSRFPIHVGGRQVGSVVGREPLDAIDQLVHQDVVLTVIELGAIVVLCVVLALALGGWLVGRPIGRLVQQARAIGKRDFSGKLALDRADELGELATEMKAASDALARAQAKIDAETEARIQAVEQLRHSERLSTVGKLAAGIAHELGTPLSIVAGHAQMIAGREVAGDAALASAEAIDREVTRMGKIVRQLLDFARRKGPEGTTCDPGVVAARCASLLGPILDRAKVRCAIECPAPAPRVLIDEDSLQQVLANLVINATQAMTGGGVVTIAIARSGERAVRIEVRDTGPGIPADALPHIFEPFFTTKEAGDGTGLGLAVVYGIVVDHRGTVDVASSERSTTIAVMLEEVAA